MDDNILLSTFKEWYQSIVDLIDSAYKRGEDICNYISYMKTAINNSDIAENSNSIYFSGIINNTYASLLKMHGQFDTRLTSFVYVFQKYTTDKYGDINTFLQTQGIMVGSSFALISNYVGYEIDPINIKGNVS